MDIVIAGAGEVGSHLATVLAADGHEITLIDTDEHRLELVSENLDLRTLAGSATHGDVLTEAGVPRAGLFISATSGDETNLLAASLAKAVGAGKAIARVHHSVYHDRRGLNYAHHLGIDRLVCPEYLTSLAIAGTLRDPAIQAIQHFARGQITMEQFEVSAQAEVIGKPLHKLSLPPGFRIGTITRQGATAVPTGDTVLAGGDQITLIGATDSFDKILRRFRQGERHAQKIVIMGGSSVSVWLARALDARSFKIRIFLTDRARAEELAAKLPHTTILYADPTDPDTFAEENIGDVDAFVTASTDDESNILGALQVRHFGVRHTLAVLQRPTYHELIEGLGIDRVFSPRIIAGHEIQRLAQHKRTPKLASLDEQGTGLYEISLGPKAKAAGQTLAQLNPP